MSKRLPYLLIEGPEGQKDKVFLTKERLTIGRFAEFNDIVLEPQFLQTVSGLGYRLEIQPMPEQV